jgi:hypothetical protein
MWPGPLIGLLLGLARATGSPDAWGNTLGDVPRAVFTPLPSRAPGPPLRRSHDLFSSFFDGEGVWETAAGERPGPPAGIEAARLPWAGVEGRRDAARLITWRGRADTSTESMYGFVLGPGETWCSPRLNAEPGSRLRFEAVAFSPRARLEVSWQGAAGRQRVATVEPPEPADLAAAAQQDVALEPGEGAACLGAAGGAVAVGEARLLAPEPPAADTRPRWIVLVLVDALRGDVLVGPEAPRNAPAILRLARSGQWYRDAVSGGSHTKAAVWPLLMGRDLMRVDPRLRLSSRWGFDPPTPLAGVYSRPNLFVSHLAEAAGYHSVFLGNDEYMTGVPAFARCSIQGARKTGTVDGIARLGDLVARYGDERIFLAFYVTTPHNHSVTPRRLYDELACGRRSGIEEMRCRYRARVRHADEAVGELQRALSAAGLAESALQVVTADHGEVFEDGWPVESDGSGAWSRMDTSHGFTTDRVQTHVPLVVSGPGLRPVARAERVSNLDIVPTLLQVMQFRAVGRLDGQALPLDGRAPPARGRERHYLSYGFCSQSDLVGDRQLVWWDESTCGRRRLARGGAPLTDAAEIWKGNSLVATATSQPEAVRPLMIEHVRGVAQRLPAAALILQTSGVESATVTVTALEGRIVDYGPSATVTGLQAIREAVLTGDGRSLRLRFEGYRGLYAITTSPHSAPVRVSVDGPGPRPVALVGPMQLPLDVLGRTIDPRSLPGYFVSRAAPPARPEAGPALRIWWEPYARGEPASRGDHLLADLNRILREWGYIR